MMEEKVFPLPAVAGELNNMVEARLHTDGGPAMDENRELQLELTGSYANPYYLLLDSETEEVLGLQAGATSPETFLEFLKGN
ncbi:MAG: hypothetical protein CMJ87_04400 [Planctomycetes bacterium]|jgi:hypothetical protein|nr:hypothetical protein [Planctomycetota bacterium]